MAGPPAKNDPNGSKSTPASQNHVVSAAASSGNGRLASLGSSPSLTAGSRPGSGSSSPNLSRQSSSSVRGRFAPKLVARRSKQERDASVPEIKSEPTSGSVSSSGGDSRSRSGSAGPNAGAGPGSGSSSGPGGRGGPSGSRGRGSGGRGGRGRGRFEPVTHAAAGALGAPSVFDPRTSRFASAAPVGDIRSMRDSASPQAEFLASRLSSVASRSPSVDPDGMVAIDMSRAAPMAADLSEYFPVRLEKRNEDEDDAEEYERAEAAEHERETERLARRRKSAVAASQDIDVKMEDDDEDIKVEEDLRQLKVASSHLRRNSKSSKDKRPGHAGLAEEEASELRRIARDHKLIAKEFGMTNGSTDVAVENRLYFFQFPALMPELIAPASDSTSSDGDDLVEIKDPATASQPDGPLPQGKLGKLRLHKSGKLTMVVGNVTMEVSQGTECSFLQDVVVVDSDAKTAHLIGQVSKKMVLSPMFI